MSFFDYLLGNKKRTAAVARERLQIILAHEHASRQTAHYLPELQRELVTVISKYITVNPQDIKVSLERQDDLNVLEVNIVLPEATKR